MHGHPLTAGDLPFPDPIVRETEADGVEVMIKAYFGESILTCRRCHAEIKRGEFIGKPYIKGGSYCMECVGGSFDNLIVFAIQIKLKRKSRLHPDGEIVIISVCTPNQINEYAKSVSSAGYHVIKIEQVHYERQ